MASAKPEKSGMGILGMFGVLIGLGCFAFVVLGALNTAFNWRLVLKFRSADIPVPNSWDVVFGLAAAGALFIGLSFFGSYVAGKFRAAKGKPLVRVGILLSAAGLLYLAFRGLQVVALTGTYGSMLAYYCTDGDLDDVKSELAKGATPEALAASVGRAAQYGNTEALKLLIAAGARFDTPRADGERQFCDFDSAKTSPEFIEVALTGGARPDACRGGEWMVFEMVRQGGDDAILSKKIEIMLKGGWSQDQIPPGTPAPAKGGKTSALAWAQKHQLKATQAVLLADRAARAAAAPVPAVVPATDAVPAAAPASVAAPAVAPASGAAPAVPASAAAPAAPASAAAPAAPATAAP